MAGEERKGAVAIVDYEYARRRFEWSKRLNWITLGVCVGLGAVAFIYGFLAYQDWQWLNEHFSGQGASSRWTPDKISAKFTTAVALMVVGVLGFLTFFLAFFFVRRALDEDKVDEVKRWSLLAGVAGVLPGAVFGGLLEFFIWRAHAAESFTMFGLLGAAPQAAPAAGAGAVAPAFDPGSVESRRKTEYDALFAVPPAVPSPAPDYAQASAPAYAYGEQAPAAAYAYGEQAPAPAYAYGQQAPAYDYTQQPAAPPQPDYGYAGAQAAAAAPADTGTQYTQQPSGAPICTCGRPMEWVPEYNRYYCYTDDKYEGET